MKIIIERHIIIEPDTSEITIYSIVSVYKFELKYLSVFVIS